MNNNNNNHIEIPEHDRRVIELLNAHIDGEISAADQLELDKLLQDSQSVRESLKEFKAVSEHISQAPELEPPGHLQSSIERQVRLPVKPVSKSGFLASLLPSQWLRNGLAVSLGVVIVVGVLEFGSGPLIPQDAAKMVGTVIKSPDQNQPVLLETITLNDDRLKGLVEMKSIEDQLRFIVQLESTTISKLVINFQEDGLEFESIEPQHDQHDLVSVTKNSVSISGEGRQNYILNFKRKNQTQIASPVAMKFFAENALIQKTKIDLSHQ